MISGRVKRMIIAAKFFAAKRCPAGDICQSSLVRDDFQHGKHYYLKCTVADVETHRCVSDICMIQQHFAVY